MWKSVAGMKGAIVLRTIELVDFVIQEFVGDL
jgi:hypothetical protein